MNPIAKQVYRFVERYYQSFSFVGLVIASLFFAGSVTPSLLPRVWIVQGVLSGFSIAIGYGLGVAMQWLWLFLELRQPNEQWQIRLKRISVVGVSIVTVFFVWQSTAWQNSIRRLMRMPELDSTTPYAFFLVAIVVAVILVTLARILIVGTRGISRRLQRFVPRRIAITISTLIVAVLAFLVSNDLIAEGLLKAADRVFLKADQLIPDGAERPANSLACGSLDSLVSWEAIGRQGKAFLTTGPSAETISELTGNAADNPIRVYVGMTVGEDVDEEAQARSQAELALAELIRVGGFDRKLIVVATPTGTGWLDEAAVDTIEYLHRGDTAIVSTQYSYLPSWITILVDPIRSKRSGKALFDAVYDHWKKLPKEDRPELYLFGLSLGALGCEESADLLDTFEDPIQGAVWSGPPFPSPQWNRIVRTRDTDSPVWLPQFRDGSMVRFTAQNNHLQTGKRWGPIRDVYIQHASDPMVWFSPDLAWERPAWLAEPRGPDVSPELRWYPVVTFLQVAFDLPLATSVPIGYGHNYSASSYIDAWTAVTEPSDWTPEKIERLKTKMRQRELT